MQPSSNPAPCPRHGSGGWLCGLCRAPSPFPADPATLHAQLSLPLALPTPLTLPAQTPVLPGSGASFTLPLVGPLLTKCQPWPSPKGWGVPTQVWGWWEPPVLLVLTKQGGSRQHRHYLHAPARREQLEQNKHSSSSFLHLHWVSSHGEHREPWPCTPRSQPALSPATAARCRGFVLLCPPSQGARRSHRDVQKFCLLP